MALVKAMYFNFVDDKARDCYFLLPQEITPLASMKQKPEVEQHVSLSLAQSTL